MNTRSTLLASISVAGLCTSGWSAAFGQSAQPAVAGAQQAAQNAPEQLEEVVITSQKRTEKLSQTTVTASVVSAELLKKMNATDIADLNQLVPAVSLNGTFNGRVPLGIRGISSDSNESAVGIASGVGVEIDGIPVPSDSFAANSIEDISAVEVLEGPQATLGGRTATSGIINYRTHHPTYDWQGSVTGTLTDDGERHLLGYVSGPLSDIVSFSLVGWGHYTVFPNKNLFYDRHSDDTDYGVRGKVKFDLTDDFSAVVALHSESDFSSGGNFTYSYIYPGAYLLAGVGGGPPFWSQAALFPKSIQFSAHNTDYSSPVAGIFQRRLDNDVSLNLEYHIDDYTLSSTTAFQQERRQSRQDLFAVDEFFGDIAAAAFHAPQLQFDNTQTEYVNTKQWSEEFKIASPTDGPFNYVGGIFFSDTSVDLNQIRHFVPAEYLSFVSPDTTTLAGYVHGAYKIFDELSIVGGLRYNYDQLGYNVHQIAYAPVYTPVRSAGSNDSTALVGDIGLKYEVTPSSQVYFTYTHGYAPKVYNTASLITKGLVLTPVAQEKIDSFEIGTKGRYFDGRLVVNASLFDTVYNNYQISTFEHLPGQVVNILSLTAAGQAETQGFELNTEWKPLPDTTVSFNGALIRAQFNSYENGPCWWAGPVSLLPSSCYVGSDGTLRANLSHKPMPNAPKVKFSVGVNQIVPLGFIPYTLDLNGTVSYRSKAQMLPDQNPYSVQSGYAVLNLSAGIVSENGDYSLTFFVNNVANTHHNVDVEDFFNGPWGSNAIIVQPARDTDRYFGVRFNMNF